jgi:hypothetical protein
MVCDTLISFLGDGLSLLADLLDPIGLGSIVDTLGSLLSQFAEICTF